MLKKIALGIVILFAIAGAFMGGTVLHELSHYNDFKKISQNEEICAFVVPTEFSFSNLNELEAGYFEFSIDPKDEQEFERIAEYTELKSYSIEIFLNALLIVCLIILVKVK